MIEPSLFTATPAPEEDVTTTLYRAAIGPVGQAYYLPIFTRFEAADHAGISWNTAASLLTLNWLVFRKLWVVALAYVGIVVSVALLVFGIGHLVLQFSDTLLMALGLGFGLAAFVLPGLFGNALLHTECRKAMSKALVEHPNVADAREALLRQASSKRRAIWLAAANAGFLLVAVLVYLQIAAWSTVSVMPHGALDAGQVVVGSAVEVSPSASAPVVGALSPATFASGTVPAASAPQAPASAPQTAAAASAPSSAAAPQPMASQPTASQPVASQPAASSPISVASAAKPAAAASASEAAKAPAVVSASEPPKAPIAPKATPKTDKSVATVPAVQVRPKKEVDRASPPARAKALQTALKPPKPVETHTTPPTTASDSATKPYFINVGLFAVPENAERAHVKLLEAQLPSVLKELKSTKGRQIRVRVGPFASRSDADTAVEKIKALQLEAVIIQP